MSERRPMSPDTLGKLIGTLIGVISLVSGLVTVATPWPTVWSVVWNFFFPSETNFSWPFLLLCIIVSSSLVWFVVNLGWHIEYVKHQETKYQLANLIERFDISEQQRLIDVITGVPNETKLKEDVESFFSNSKSSVSKPLQMILIDLKRFRSVNKRFGFLKGDALLRYIAQSFFQSMRRNEVIYKRPFQKDVPIWKQIPEFLEQINPAFRERVYRKYPGGDEFIFLIQGEQPDALGFIINRIFPQFKEFSTQTQKILGESITLSFHCGVAPVLKGDTYDQAFERVQTCYMRAAELNGDFTIEWFPKDIEEKLHHTDFRRKFYKDVRDVFSTVKKF